MITEPKQVNSGVMQGPFLKRHVCLRQDGSPYMPEDFAIGIDIAIYGRCYRIYDVDQYTRDFFRVSQLFKTTASRPCPLLPFTSTSEDVTSTRAIETPELSAAFHLQPLKTCSLSTELAP